MRQSKIESFLESLFNTFVGFVISWAAQAIIFWAYDIQASHSQQAIIVGWMTLISICRSYVVRRIWERRLMKRLHSGEN